MHCLESRRLLSADPRARSEAHSVHIAACAECAKFASALAALGRSIDEAALVPAPDALVDRVMLARRGVPAARYAAAAALVLAVALTGVLGGDAMDEAGLSPATHAVGPTHPALAAIAEVVEEEHTIVARSDAQDETGMKRGLEQLGLSVRQPDAARYVGKCHIEGSRDCERIVLSTPDAHANVMLVSDYPFPDRMLVSDRRMVALVSPARDGGYIVVAKSRSTARRLERLLVKG